MLPYEIFQKVFKTWMRYCGAAIGHYVIAHDFKVSIETVISVFGIYLYTICCFYTICTYDMETVLRALSVTGLGTQVIFFISNCCD